MRPFEAMVRRADVLYENYRAGTMEGLGYGWKTLKSLNSRLVYAATSGFGQTGPYRHRPAYDMVVQAMGGIVSITGHPGGPPTRVGMSIGDIAAGLFTALGVVSALQHRARSGEGMMVDVAMLDSQVALLENAVARYSATGIAPGPLGARHPSVCALRRVPHRGRPYRRRRGARRYVPAFCRDGRAPPMARRSALFDSGPTGWPMSMR